LKYRLTIGLLIIVPVLWAQQPVQERISSAGGNYTGGGVSLSWSLGAPVVPTLRSAEGKLVLTHGFQEKITVTPDDGNIIPDIGIIVFPNPVSGILKIRFAEPPRVRIGLAITDSEGRIVISRHEEGFGDLLEVDLGMLSGGLYLLRLDNGNRTNFYKIIKL